MWKENLLPSSCRNNGSDRGTEKITEKTCTISFSLRVRPLSRFRGIECVLKRIRKRIRYPPTPGPNEMLVWSREHAHARSFITFRRWDTSSFSASKGIFIRDGFNCNKMRQRCNVFRFKEVRFAWYKEHVSEFLNVSKIYRVFKKFGRTK